MDKPKSITWEIDYSRCTCCMKCHEKFPWIFVLGSRGEHCVEFANGTGNYDLDTSAGIIAIAAKECPVAAIRQVG